MTDQYQKFVKWFEKNNTEAVYGQMKGLSKEEILKGLNEGNSPLKQFSEKRGCEYGSVIPIDVLAKRVAFMTRAELTAMKTYFRKHLEYVKS